MTNTKLEFNLKELNGETIYIPANIEAISFVNDDLKCQYISVTQMRALMQLRYNVKIINDLD